MARKILYTLFLLAGMLLLAFCTSRQASPIPQAEAASPSPETETANPTGQAQIPNPASVYCEQNGGRLELREDASGGVAGKCIFPDGSECDEWAYFRGVCKPGDSLAKAGPAAAQAAALRVVYFKNGQIMSWTEGKGPQSLAQADAEQLRISDDGQMVAYLGADSNGVFDLYSVEADGSNPRRLVESAEAARQVVSFDFAPGSHTLYFVTDQYDLQRVEASSASPVQVFGAGEGGFFSFSPDGQWMTLYHPNELVLSKTDGSTARVAFQYPPDFSYTMMGPEIAWKADQAGFSLVSASEPLDESPSMSVWFISVEGEAIRQMSYAGPYGANLAPDGSTVVYLYFQHEPVDVHIVTPGGKDTAYTSYSSELVPALKFMGWAPDSQSFLLNLSKDGRFMDPYLCKAGESPVKLTDTEYASAVTWVDTERILFISAGSLRMQQSGEASVVLDAVSSGSYDFTILNP